MNLIEPTTPKKPHPLSKEGRKLWENKTREMETTPIEKTIVTTTPVETPKVEEPKSNNNDQMTYIMEEISKLKSENEVLKDKMTHPTVKGHEINNDPKMFSYKMRGGIPVLSYVSKRKDPSKDFIFKNQFGQYDDSNHLLVLSLADGTTIDVQITEFNRDVTRSEKMTAKDHHGEVITNENLNLVKSFTFNDLGMTFTVLPNSVN